MPTLENKLIILYIYSPVHSYLKGEKLILKISRFTKFNDALQPEAPVIQAIIQQIAARMVQGIVHY